MAAYGVATKYIRANLRLITTSHTAAADSNEPPTPPTPPTPSTSDTIHSDKDIETNSNQRALRMESELLHLLNYNLAIHEPSHLVWWSKTFEVIPDEYSHV